MKFKTGLFIFILALLLSACDQAPETTATESGYSDREAIDNILSRKSVRSYKADGIEREKMELIARAGMAAPSGMDRRPWEIIILTDRSIMDRMAAGLPYAKMLADAPAAMIVCGNSELSSYWYLDCSAVTQNILLAAEALGIGAVWTAAYPYDDRIEIVRDNIVLPENIIPLAIIPMGYPHSDNEPKDKYDESKLHWDKW